MNRPECAVKKCKNGALVLYGGSWVCGYCIMRLIEKEQNEKRKQVEELEI